MVVGVGVETRVREKKMAPLRDGDGEIILYDQLDFS